MDEKELEQRLKQIQYWLLCTNDETIIFVEKMLEAMVDRFFGGVANIEPKQDAVEMIKAARNAELDKNIRLNEGS